VCCSVLQCVAVCCNGFLNGDKSVGDVVKDTSESCLLVTACCGELQPGAVCCSVFQRVAVYLGIWSSAHAKVSCSLHCVAACCSVLKRVATFYSVLQYVAVCCSVLQCVSAYCSVASIWMCNVLLSWA